MTHMGRAADTDDIIRVMQEGDELAAQRRIMENMTPRLREKFDQIHELIENETHVVLRNRYELGVLFKAIYDDETDNGAKVYGRHAVDNVTRLLGVEQSFVRNCIAFARLYTRGDLESLCSRLLPRGEHLCWSHVRCLLRVNDEVRRKELLERIFAEGLTCAELAFTIDTPQGGGNGTNRGRPLKVPPNFDAVVAQQKQVTEEWERRNQRVWSDPRHSIAAKAQELSDDDVTEQRLNEAEELARLLRRQANEANKAAEKAEAVVERFRLILSKRAGTVEEDEVVVAGNLTSKRQSKQQLAEVA
jgi:hypothetical protein